MFESVAGKSQLAYENNNDDETDELTELKS